MHKTGGGLQQKADVPNSRTTISKGTGGPNGKKQAVGNQAVKSQAVPGSFSAARDRLSCVLGKLLYLTFWGKSVNGGIRCSHSRIRRPCDS